MNGREGLVFNTFDREAEIEIRERKLPHWFQVGVAMFVTFRTADSIPKRVLLRWQRELVEWLKSKRLPCDLANSMVGNFPTDRSLVIKQIGFNSYREFKRLSDRVFHRSLDECYGDCLLRDPLVAQIVAEAILHFDGDRYDLDCFIVMPNHVHAIVQFRAVAGLEIVSQSWMRFSARRINRMLNRKGPLWQPEPFDHIIRSQEQFLYLQRYIAENPQKANVPSSECLYWSRSALRTQNAP